MTFDPHKVSVGTTVYRIRWTTKEASEFAISEGTYQGVEGRGNARIMTKAGYPVLVPFRQVFLTYNDALTAVCDVLLIRRDRIDQVRNRLIEQITKSNGRIPASQLS